MIQPTRWLRSVSPYLIVESMKTRNFETTKSQLLDAVQSNKLQTTLEHLHLFDTSPLNDGDLLPPCFHFAYFTPNLTEAELSPDGADPTFNPGGTFTRRMWAGGQLDFCKENPLRIGQVVQEVTTLDRVESKQTRAKQPMIVVSGRKQYSNEKGLALTDTRSWLFREPAAASVGQQIPDQVQQNEKSGTIIGAIRATEITLFRYSALTFNSHKIHYDRQWCRDMEAQPDLVVHGPLNITLLANVWQRVFNTSPKSIRYRALSPVHVNEEYFMMHNDKDIWCQNSHGKVIMSATEASERR